MWSIITSQSAGKPAIMGTGCESILSVTRSMAPFSRLPWFTS